jgi:hypothetical protein
MKFLIFFIILKIENKKNEKKRSKNNNNNNNKTSLLKIKLTQRYKTINFPTKRSLIWFISFKWLNCQYLSKIWYGSRLKRS